jgi:hypothetical protein
LRLRNDDSIRNRKSQIQKLVLGKLSGVERIENEMWAVRVSNPRPTGCKPAALPLS